MRKTPTCLIEKSSLLREGLKSLLNQAHFSPVTEFSQVDSLVTSQQKEFDLVIIGCEQSPCGIANTVRAIKSKNNDTRVVILSECADRDSLTSGFSAGADGFLMKDISAKAFIASLDLVMTGEKVMPTSMASVIASGWEGWLRQGDHLAAANSEFSVRETQIIRCLAAGASNKVIAKDLNISEATVKVHLKAILRKLGFSNRTQIAIWAVNNGIASGLQGSEETPASQDAVTA